MRAFTLITAVLAAAAVAVAQAAAPLQTPCLWDCPPRDNVGNAFTRKQAQPYESFLCEYEGFGTCTYTKYGGLEWDDDDDNCPLSAVKPCASKHLNIMSEISIRRALEPVQTLPDTAAKPAALKTKHAAD